MTMRRNSRRVSLKFGGASSPSGPAEPTSQQVVAQQGRKELGEVSDVEGKEERSGQEEHSVEVT